MTRYRPLTRDETHPRSYLPGMDPDDPLVERRNGRTATIGVACILIGLAFALIAVAAGWA